MYSESKIETELTEFQYSPTEAERAKIDEKPIITIKDGQMNFEDNPRFKTEKMQEEKNNLKKKLDEGKVKLEDVINFITQYIT